MNVQNKLIGLNQAWQSNANLENIIKENYPDYVLSSYKDIENYLGLKNENNIKKWFDGYLERVYNVDTEIKIKNSLFSKVNDTVPWRISKDIEIINWVNYNNGKLLKGKMHHPDSVSMRIFEEYIDYIKYSLPELSKKENRVTLNDFDRYNAIILKRLYPNNLKDFVLISPYIKIHRFFIASATSRKIRNNKDTTYYSMAVYPYYADQTFNSLVVPDRPWYKAAIQNKFPLHYKTTDKNYSASFGLTGLYNDITTTTTTVLDRTFTCNFTIPNLNKNTRYIACLDFFFDNSVEFICPSPFTISRNANVDYTSFTSFFPFLGIPFLPLGFCSLIDAFLIFWISLALAQIQIIKKYVIRGLEGIINQINSEDYKHFVLERGLVHSLTIENIQNPPVIEFENIIQTKRRQEESNEKGIGFNGFWKGIFIIIKKSWRKELSTEQNVKVSTNTQLTLGIDNVNYYRRIEYWTVFENRSRTKESGKFIVKWLNAIYTKEEIAIDLVGEFKSKLTGEKLNTTLVFLKKEFETRLLNGEEGKFEVRVDLRQATIRPQEIPLSIKNSKVKNESIEAYFTRIGRLNRFFEKKLFFRHRDRDTTELDFFLQLYKNMNIYSVCGISFLENLSKNNSLYSFLINTGDKERVFIESAEDEFFDFFKSTQIDIQLAFKGLSPDKFFIFSYDQSRVEKINKYKYYDFALVKNDNSQTEYILYHTPTSTTAEIGWASWRKIDIDFYMAVYQVIRTDVYLDRIPIFNYLESHESN